MNTNKTTSRKNILVVCLRRVLLVGFLLVASQCCLFAQAALTVREVAFWSDLGLPDAAIAAKLATASPRPRFSEAEFAWLQSTAAKTGLVETVRPYVVKTGTGPGSSGNTGSGGGSSSGDLSGLWRNPGGNGVYRFRHIGNKLHWGIDAVTLGSFANVFQGDISGATIEGAWLDLPGSPFMGGGKLFLRIESACKIVKTSEVNHYGAEIWVKQNSTCDVTGLTQRTNPSGSKPTNSKTKPATATTTTNDDSIIAIGDASGVFENPSNARPKPTPQAKNQPKVQDIPENAVRQPTGSGSNRSGGTTESNATNTRPPTTNQPSQPQRAGCQAGPYSLSGLNQPRSSEQVMLKFTAPAGRGIGSGDWVGVFRAGETVFANNRLVTWMFLTSPDCVERFYLPAGEFDAYIFDKSNKDTDPHTPITAGERLTVRQ